MQIKIGNTIVAVDQGISLPLVYRSPLFITAENRIPGSYIFNTSFAATPQLRQEFAQAHRVQRHGRATAELPYVITAYGLRFVGTCVGTQADQDKYEVSFRIDNGDFAGTIAGKTLKDLLWGDDIVITDFYSVASVENIVVSYNDPLYEGFITFTVNEPLHVIKDITSSMGVDGRTFVADQDTTCTQSIVLNTAFTSGSLQVIARKNGVAYFDETYSAQPGGTLPPAEIVNSLTLITGDIVTVELVCITESLFPAGTIADIFISVCLVEYKKTNLFDVVVTQDQDSADFTVFPIHNKEFLSNFPDDIFELDNLSIKTIYTQYIKVLNYYKNGEFPLMIWGNVENEPFVAANLFTPFIYLNTIVKKIATEAGYSIVNNPFDTVYFKNAVLFNAYAENTYSSDSTTKMPVNPSFNLVSHVPAMLQSDFMNWISQLTGYIPIVDNNTRTITFIDIKAKSVVTPTNQAVAFPGILLPSPKVTVTEEYKGIKFELKSASADKYLANIKPLNEKLVYKGTVIDIYHLSNLGNKVNDMYLVTSLNEFWVWQYSTETYLLAWVFYSKNFQIVYTDGEEPYLQRTTNLCPVLSSYIADDVPGAPATRHYILPVTEQPGILEGFPDSLGSEYGTQVLYFKGMSLDSLAQPYPLGTCRYDDYSGDPLFFPDLNAESIFNNRWKEFLRWLAYESKPATFRVVLTPVQLKQLQSDQVDQIYSGNGFMFLIKEIRVNMLSEGLSVAEMDVYTC